MPPDKRKHNEIAHRIYQELTRILGGSDSHTLLGTAFIEMGYRFTGPTWLQPDVSITHQGEGGDDYFRGAPALAVEVVSE